jgi:hypothetical protein
MGRPLEEEMLYKYVARRWPEARVWFHVRLGKLPDEFWSCHPGDLRGRSLLEQLSFLLLA